MRILVPLVLLLLVAAVAGGTVYHLRHSAAMQRAAAQARESAEQARESAEQAMRDVERAAADVPTAHDKLVVSGGEGDVAHAEITDLRAKLAAAKRRIQDLESDLQSEIRRREDVDQLIAKTSALLRTQREQHNKEIWEARRFMPEGVRVAMVTVNERLREDRHPEFRFLKAMKIEDKVLHDVQVLDRDATSLSPTIYIAKRVTFGIDRAKATLTITFMDGFSRGPNGREALSEAGTAVTLPDIDGRQWESRLPFLVKATGAYPVAIAKVSKPKMERTRRDGWRRRVNALLGKATTGKRYRLETFRDLESGRFREALLLGYDDKKKLAMSAEAEWLSVQVDDRGEYVELLLSDGILRKRGGETPIPDGGYRIRLTGIEPSEAIEGMLGMVKRK